MSRLIFEEALCIEFSGPHGHNCCDLRPSDILLDSAGEALQLRSTCYLISLVICATVKPIRPPNWLEMQFTYVSSGRGAGTCLTGSCTVSEYGWISFCVVPQTSSRRICSPTKIFHHLPSYTHTKYLSSLLSLHWTCTSFDYADMLIVSINITWYKLFSSTFRILGFYKSCLSVCSLICQYSHHIVLIIV